jgi:hypothetical protein
VQGRFGARPGGEIAYRLVVGSDDRGAREAIERAAERDVRHGEGRRDGAMFFEIARELRVGRIEDDATEAAFADVLRDRIQRRVRYVAILQRRLRATAKGDPDVLRLAPGADAGVCHAVATIARRKPDRYVN